MDNYACKICNNTTNNLIFEAREMMFGLREKFKYMECAECKCIQLLQPPADMAKYYPDDYYSYHGNSEDATIRKTFFKTLKRNLKKQLLDNYLEEKNFIGKLMQSKFQGYYPWIKQRTLKSNSKILDVGCGSGELLLRMYNDGFRNLTGIDPYISNEIEYECGIKIHKKQLNELNESFDVIMLHHAFEHMDEPMRVLQNINRLLVPGGLLMIRIPVGNCYAWRKYKADWVQLDAPRHFFLHTPQSMKILSEQSGFDLFDILYDSYYLQFSGSEKYLQDIPLKDKRELFTTEEIEDFNKESAKLNAMNEGDQACFYLRKTSDM